MTFGRELNQIICYRAVKNHPQSLLSFYLVNKGSSLKTNKTHVVKIAGKGHDLYHCYVII